MKERVVLGLAENVKILSKEKGRVLKARIDTGATKSSMDMKIAAELGLGPVTHKRKVKSAHGITMRPVIKAKIDLHGKEIEEEFTLAERDHMTYPVLIGQNILKKGKFLVDPLL